MSTINSHGILKLADAAEIKTLGSTGAGDARLTLHRLPSGMEVIETNGEPVWDHEEGFAALRETIMGGNYGTLCDYRTGTSIRPASRDEWQASREAEAGNVGGGTGVIQVDGRSVYVDGGDEQPSPEVQA